MTYFCKCAVTKDLFDISQNFSVDKNSDLLHKHFVSRPPPPQKKHAYIILECSLTSKKLSEQTKIHVSDVIA